MADNNNTGFWASKRRQETILDMILFIFAWAMAIVFLLPFFWMISTSLKLPSEVAKKEVSAESMSIDDMEKKGTKSEQGSGAGFSINLLPIKHIMIDYGTSPVAQDSGRITFKAGKNGKYITEYRSGGEVLGIYEDIPLAATFLVKNRQVVKSGDTIAVLPSKGKIKFVMTAGKVTALRLINEQGYDITGEPLSIPPFTKMLVKDGSVISKGQRIATVYPQWQNYAGAWLSDEVKPEFKAEQYFTTLGNNDVILSKNINGKVNVVKSSDKIIVSIVEDSSNILAKIVLPSGAKMLVKQGDMVEEGTKLASLAKWTAVKDMWIAEPLKKKSFWTRLAEEVSIESGSFTRYFLNTVFITLMTIIAVIFSSTFVAYGFSRFKFPFRDQLFLVMISTMMIPMQVTLIPTFVVFTKLGWVNTYLPFIVPLFFGGSAFNIFLLRQFIMTIPYELDDAAKIDGCNYMQIFTIILLPLVKPALVTVAIFACVASWNDYLGPLVYLRSPQSIKTIAVGLSDFTSKKGSNFAYLMSASLVMLLPILVVFFVGQKYFIEGIATSGLKG